MKPLSKTKKSLAISKYSNRIEKHIAMVAWIAHDIHQRLATPLLLEDLVQIGIVGLLEAETRFDPEKGANFKTYAGIRVRGSILDEVRRYNWLPRSVYQRIRQTKMAKQQLAQQYGKTPSDHHVANQLGITMKAYHQLLLDESNRYVSSYEDLENHNIEANLIYGNANQVNPCEHCEKNESYSYLLKSIIQLTQREKKILLLYYYHEYNLKEIGVRLNLSESRVCQLHTQAVNKLRDGDLLRQMK